jgi:hypothetical protein
MPERVLAVLRAWNGRSSRSGAVKTFVSTRTVPFTRHRRVQRRTPCARRR